MSDSLPEIALRFCRECLGWEDAFEDISYIDDYHGIDVVTRPSPSDDELQYFNLNSIEEAVVSFLGARYWIQINRGLNSDWKWMVSVGEQNQQDKGACREQAIAVNDDLGHAMLEACVKAVALGPVP